MNKINLYIKPVYSYNSIITKELKIFYNNFSLKCDKYFNLIKIDDQVDIILIHIFEVLECKQLPKKNIILYFHFKPSLQEIKIINNLIISKSVVLIISHFNIKEWKIHQQLLWPINEDLIIDFKGKKKYTVISQELFNFEFTNLINNNIEPITDNQWVLSKKYQNIIDNKKIPIELSYLSFIKKIFDIISISLNISKNFVFFPLLNILNNFSIESNQKKCQERCLTDKHSDLCYSTSNKIKHFYPWGLSLMYDNLQEGLYIKKKNLENHSINTNELLGYHNLFLLEIPDIYKQTDKWNSIIHDNNGINYKGIPSLLDFKISDKTLYIKKPELLHRKSYGIIVYIDNNEHIPNLLNLIKKINNNYHIEINYDIDLTCDISKIDDNSYIKKNPIDLSKFQNSNLISLELKLYCLLISNFVKCIFVDLNLVTWGNYKSLFFKLEKYDCFFFASITQPSQINNLFRDINDELYLNEYESVEPIETGLFGINIIECWITIQISLGFISKYSKDILLNKSIELIYLALLIQKKKIFLINSFYKEINKIESINNTVNEKGLNCHGYLENDLFIGYPIYFYNDFYFTFIPFWYSDYKTNYMTNNLDTINWKYSNYFDCIVCDGEDCYLTDTSKIIK